MLGERIPAAELHAHGLIHSLVPPGSALSHASALAEELNARACNVNASLKELINASTGQGLNEQMQLERDHFVRNLHHPNAGIGIESFLSKKAPQFKTD
jgi:enoyl-CoA hydratase/carnithine racemase